MLDSPIQKIKDKLDIVEVIGSYIKLQKAGKNYKALCPFHSEKTPSLFVSPERQIWHCFGCGRGGDIFTFVKEIEGVEFGDALRILARRAGVELKSQPPELRTKRQRFYEICELAAKFFERQLESKSGKAAKKYLLGRGLTEKSIKEWRIGYAPDTWESLSNFLVSKGYERKEVVEAGLAVEPGQNKTSYDRFRGRIIFPIFDLNSQVVGFGGRVMQDSDKTGAKYINTPNTLIYDKSRILYGLDKAKMAIREKDSCIITEGYVDAILVHQTDFKNAVAVSGTALTPLQLKILNRYSNNLLTCFDMDVAGASATKRGIDLAQEQGFNIRVIELPQGKDPADVISQNPHQWEQLVNSSLSILDFYFRNAFAKFDKSMPEGKKKISEVLLPVISRIPNRIEMSDWVQRLSRELGVKDEIIEQELKKYLQKTVPPQPPEISSSQPKKSRKDILEERILCSVLKSPSVLNLIGKEHLPLFSERNEAILTDFKKNPLISLSEFNQKFPQFADFLNYLSLKSEVELEDINPEEEVLTCLHELKLIDTKGKLDRISQQIKTAEAGKDSKNVNKLLQEFNELAKELAEETKQE